jgi:RNA polymerase sigma-70 factor (ECF subfamily)
MASDAEPSPFQQSTTQLLVLAQNGDGLACNLLVKKHLPALRRWAHGRLPVYARDLIDTDDLVQITMLRALDHLKGFESKHAGAFFAYLRQILLNRIRDEIRKTSRRPAHDELGNEIQDAAPSPLDQAVGSDARERYEQSLRKLSEDQQEAVVLRLELGFTYEEMAEALERPSANAARLLVTRALVKLAREMHERFAPEPPR